jgi:hypothetical protein
MELLVWPWPDRYVPEWFGFVEHCFEFMQLVASPMHATWSEKAGKPLKIFGTGESMGGGVLATLV